MQLVMRDRKYTLLFVCPTLWFRGSFQTNMKFVVAILAPQMINLSHFGPSMSYPPAPPSDFHGLAGNIHVPQRTTPADFGNPLGLSIKTKLPCFSKISKQDVSWSKMEIAMKSVEHIHAAQRMNKCHIFAHSKVLKIAKLL